MHGSWMLGILWCWIAWSSSQVIDTDECVVVRTCSSCAASEADEDYCQATGYKQELKCKTSKAEEVVIKFQSCVPEAPRNGSWKVLLFEILMGMLFAGSIYTIRKRRQQMITRADVQKDPYQRHGLLDRERRD